MVIRRAGLQTGARSLYEAAVIRGASRWRAYWVGTCPGRRTTSVPVLTVGTLRCFALFLQIGMMIGGGQRDRVQIMVFRVVERGYGKQQISGGATDFGHPFPTDAHGPGRFWRVCTPSSNRTLR
jgi:multiple sugar transport system permease protein